MYLFFSNYGSGYYEKRTDSSFNSFFIRSGKLVYILANIPSMTQEKSTISVNVKYSGKKRELWKDGHYHIVLRKDGKIIASPRWSSRPEKNVSKLNKAIDKYDKKNYTHPLEAQTGYVLLRDKEHSNMKYHYKVWVPTSNGGYYCTVRTPRKLSPDEVRSRASHFAGRYGDRPDYDMMQIQGLEIYSNA